MPAVLLTADLACSSQVTGAGQRAGVEVSVAMTVSRLLELAAETFPRLVILDLTTPGLNCTATLGELKSLPQPPESIIAFGPHVHEARLQEAQAAGCDLVLARGQFYAQVGRLLAERG